MGSGVWGTLRVQYFTVPVSGVRPPSSIFRLTIYNRTVRYGTRDERKSEGADDESRITQSTVYKGTRRLPGTLTQYDDGTTVF